MFFWRKKKKISIRDCVYKQYSKYFFYKKKWKDIFEASILVISEEYGLKYFERFHSMPHVELLVLKNVTLKKCPKLPHCKKIYIYECSLHILPPLPNCLEIYISQSSIFEIKSLPKCKKIYSHSNSIQHMKQIPNCKKLYSYSNQMEELPDCLEFCRYLNVKENSLQSLPYLSKCRKLKIHSNPISSLIINNLCKVEFEKSRQINILRFGEIQNLILDLFKSYDKWFFSNFKIHSPIKKYIQRLSFMNDKKENLGFMKTILIENLNGIVLFLKSNTVYKADFNKIKIFLRTPI